MTSIQQLAREGHGAIQVDEPPAGKHPHRVTLIGPIKYWWSLPEDEWGTGDHAVYIEWRDAVEAAFVKAGFLVYLPHKAWRGAWHESAQSVNDEAIWTSDVVVNLTPPGIPHDGTSAEIDLAGAYAVPVLDLPPGELLDIFEAIATIREDGEE